MFNSDHPLHQVFVITLGIGFFGLGWFFIFSSGSDSKELTPLSLLAGLTFFTVGVCVLAAPAAKRVVEWFSRQFGELFFSDNELHGPQPIYSIPEARRARGDIQGAWEALEKIAEEFPQEFKVYTQLIDIAVMESADFSLAEEVLAQGLSALKKNSDREALQHAHALIVERLHTREERSARLKSLGGQEPDAVD